MSEYIIRTTNMPIHVREALSTWYEIDCEIVRCRDCRYYVMHKCDYPDGNGDFLRIIVPPEHFCAWGERRSE